MNTLPKLLVTVLFACYMANMTIARGINSTATLKVRLKLDEEGSSDCWNSLVELQSCTGELILFFLNGEIYLGPACCSAIQAIEHDCWPSMLGTLGFTAEEGDILLGYCDSGEPSPSTPPPLAVDQIINTSRATLP